jgi:hypothetical protein
MGTRKIIKIAISSENYGYLRDSIERVLGDFVGDLTRAGYVTGYQPPKDGDGEDQLEKISGEVSSKMATGVLEWLGIAVEEP